MTAHRRRHADTPIRPMMRFGQHLAADLEGCPAELLENPQVIRDWTVHLIDDILKMVRYGPLILEHFGHDDPVTAGYTAVQLIETSSVTAHFSPFLGTAHIDVFSCRQFDEKSVLDYCEATFGAHRTIFTVLDR